MSLDFISLIQLLSWVSFSVLASVFGYALVKWLLNIVWPVRYVTVNHFHNGELIDTAQVDLKSSTSLVKQLKELERRREGGR